MSKEFTLARHDFDINGDSGNCMTDSIGSILGIVSPHTTIDRWRVYQALPITSNYYLTNLFELLKRHGISPTDHEALDVPAKRAFIFKTIKDLLYRGGICELTVESTPWIENVLNAVDFDPDGSLHAVFVYGFYQPDETIEAGWYYMADPYRAGKLFVSSDELYNVLSFYERRTIINVFGLSQDNINLTSKYSTKKAYRHHMSMKAIERRSGGVYRLVIPKPKLQD